MFEVEDRDVSRLQLGRPVADIHAYAVDQVIAVGLDNDLPSWGRDVT